MVTHYRHTHIRYYNRWVHYHSRFRDYETFKTTVNNRVKRNILRKCKPFLKQNGFTVQDFEALQGTDDKTLKLAVKILGGRTTPRPTKEVTLDLFLEQ